MTVINFRNKSNNLSKSDLFDKPKISSESNELEAKLSSVLVKLQNIHIQLENLERSTSHFFDYYYEFITTNNNSASETKSQLFPEIISTNKNLDTLLSKIYKTMHEICANDKLAQVKENSHTSAHNLDLLANLTKLEEYLGGSDILNPSTSVWQKIDDMEARCLEYLQKIRHSHEVKVESTSGDLKRQLMWCTVCCEELAVEIKDTISKFLAA